MKILAYKGKSWISRAIRWQTRSPYSHIAVQLDGGSVIEAWHKGGVRHRSSPFEGHAEGTEIDVFEVKKDYRSTDVFAFLRDQLGKKYDFVAVGRFVTRREVQADDKWFCSELAEAAFAAGGLQLLNGSPSRHSPRDTVMSPYLVYEKTIGGDA